jgi:general secretion pathway protein E
VEEQAAYEGEMGELPSEFYKGVGCNLCVDTGYIGRIGIFEILVMTEDIKRLLISNAPPREIREQALRDGMVPLMHDGMIKVKEGITTISEVMRNVYSLGQ